jgi:GntR family transcriptional regulator, rspAB operon transcriptional repressor
MEPVTRKDEAYSALLERIYQGQIAPGSPLREVRLAEDLGISRTPLREAIRQLSRDGLVECLPHCGARVIQPDEKLVSNIFQIREALEGMAAREAAKNFAPGALDKLRDHFEQLRPRIAAGDDADVGDEIHDQVLALCQNSELAALMGKYHEMISWFQRLASQVPGRLTEAYREHEAILSAIEARDAEWAERAARAHVRNTLRDLLPHLAETFARSAAPRRHKKRSRMPEAAIRE